MKVIHSPAELRPEGRKVCLGIGFFDGVHLGHQQILRQTLAEARQHESLAVVLTFDAHPNTAVAPDRVPPLVYPLWKKVRVLESLGPDMLLLLHFDEALSRQSGEVFVRDLVRHWGAIRSITVGANFCFGHKRSGNVELLRQLGAELKFSVHGTAAVALDGKVVSSTRIRQTILDGDLDAATQMLGRAYSLVGRVERGDGIGRQLGFPTANVDSTGLALPPRGVYAVHTETRRGVHRAVLNIGYRPTLQNPVPQLRVEAHLLDFSGDLYGEEIELVFVEKIREERKFAALSELQAQIRRDIEEARLKF
jgi:riboflavin kinase/FMN adenylyltransferase